MAECWGDEIAGDQHLARDLYVTRLVWSNEREFAETVKIKSDDDGEKEKVDSLGKR